MNTAMKNSPPKPLVSRPKASLKKSRNDWMSHVAMSRARSRPIIPLTTEAQRATTTSCESVVRRKRFQKSMEKAVATLLMLLDMVLMVAAKMAAIKTPAMPAGIWLIMKKGKMASDCPMVTSSSVGWVL